MPVMKRRRVGMITLVGEQNPYGGDVHYALYPHPDGCAGHRLCRLVLGMTRDAYLRSFRRVNLCGGPWKIADARERALSLRNDAMTGDRFILCGAKVCAAFGTPFTPMEESGMGVVRLLVLPHPSGLCRLWNVDGAFQRARDAVLRMCPELGGVLGVGDNDDEPTAEADNKEG